MATKMSLFMLTIACLALSAMSRSTFSGSLAVTGLSPNNVDSIKPDDFIQDIAACWASLLKVPDCVADIYREFLGNRGFASPDCCQAISNVTADCWPKMFVQNPIFPSILLNNCNGTTAPSPQPFI